MSTPLKDGELTQSFIHESTKLCDFAASIGVHLRPFDDPAVKIFSALSSIKQKNVLTFLLQNNQVFSEASEEGMDLDSPKILWRFLKNMGAVPLNDIFDKIERNDIVEIYDGDGIGIFRNLRFYDVVTATVEELTSLPWYRLARMSLGAYGYLFEVNARFKLGLLNKTFAPLFKNYIGVERVGDHRRFSVNLKYISPFKKNGQWAGAIVINQAKILQRDY